MKNRLTVLAFGERGGTAQRRAVAGLFVAILVGSSMTIFVRLSDAPSGAKVFYRLLFSVALVGPLALIRYREEFLVLSARDVTSIIIAGVMLGTNLVLFFESLKWTSIAAATALAQTQLVFVAAGSYVLLSERINRRTIAGIVVALLGVTVMSLTGLVSRGLFVGERPVYGNTLALIASISFAGYLLTGRSLRQRISLFPYITIVYAASTVAVLVFALLTDITLAPRAYPLHEWLLFLGMAISAGVVTHTMINFALEHLDSNTVSIVLLGYPVVSAVYAFAFLGEVPDLVTIGGGAVILFGIYITTGDH